MKKIYYLSLIITAGLLLLNVAFAEVKTPKNPKSAKACALCHYRWVDTFFIEGKGSDLVPYQSEKVVATSPMCLSCHDGSIMDSRSRINGDTGHKTDMPPPAAMKIPITFPLDEAGKIQCATCHTAHGVPSGTGHDPCAASVILEWTAKRAASITPRVRLIGRFRQRFLS
jgi:hypothetical protein